MPFLAQYKYIIFFIVAHDALNEPPHVHITTESGNRGYTAKLWLESLTYQTTGDLTQKELNLCKQLAEKYRNELLKQIEDFKKGKRFLQ